MPLGTAVETPGQATVTLELVRLTGKASRPLEDLFLSVHLGIGRSLPADL
jgi:hypothetical protein